MRIDKHHVWRGIRIQCNKCSWSASLGGARSLKEGCAEMAFLLFPFLYCSGC